MENGEIQDTYNEVDFSWIDEFYKNELEYALFYKEQIYNIKVNYIYIDKTNSIDYIHQENVKIENGKLDKETLIDIIKKNKKKMDLDYKLLNIFKYNIILDHEHIKDYLNNNLNDDFLSKVDMLQDIYFKDTIKLFKDLNCLYIFFCDKTMRENKNKLTKRFLSLMSIKRKKTKRRLIVCKI